MPPDPSPRRLPHRFRRKLLAVLAIAGLAPLLLWGYIGDSLLEGALALAPPVESMLAGAASALGETGRHDALAADLRAAELHLVQADLARRRLLEMAPLYFLVALLGSAAIIAVAAWLLGRRISRPIEALAAAMARIGRGELEHQVTPSGRGDELDHLAVELDRMRTELVRQRARLQVTEALAAWRDAARALAHDLKNPLTAMRMAIGRLQRPGRSELATEEAAALLQEELDVLIRMSQSFSEFARLPEPRPRALALAALVEEVAALYRAEAGARLEVAIETAATVAADPDQLRRALGNLVKNAIEAGADAAPIVVSVRPGDEAGWVRIEVRDAGRGIAAPLEGQQLMAGLGSAKAGRDRGLGLPIAHKILHEHGGRLRLVPASPRGTAALVDLPLAVASAGAVGLRVAAIAHGGER